jgi:hypothetical protein
MYPYSSYSVDFCCFFFMGSQDWSYNSELPNHMIDIPDLVGSTIHDRSKNM